MKWPPPGTTLWCSICIYTADRDTGPDAITIINGHAVCVDHIGYVAGPYRTHQDILRFVIERSPFDTLTEMQEANRAVRVPPEEPEAVTREGLEPSRPERGTDT